MLGTRINAGDDSNNIIGNDNTVNNIHLTIAGSRTFRRSLIYDISCVIALAPIENTANYSISTNSGWDEKIRYNRVKKYKDIFNIHCLYYDAVEDALEGLSNSRRDSLITNIKTLYCNFKNDSLDGDKDKILDEVYKSLMELINDSDSIHNALYEEEKSTSLYSIMFYAFTKCQLLDPVPENGDENAGN